MICMQIAIVNQSDHFASEWMGWVIEGQVNDLHAIVASLQLSAFFQPKCSSPLSIGRSNIVTCQEAIRLQLMLLIRAC